MAKTTLLFFFANLIFPLFIITSLNVSPILNVVCIYPPYGIDFPGGLATGRYTNGKNVVDFITDQLGIPSLPPSRDPSTAGHSPRRRLRLRWVGDPRRDRRYHVRAELASPLSLRRKRE
ncbi:unnamed protein product [Linum trigynum]|uniref:Uncharacterized protein n=1 Tax=Linum trigynum TaxID=586398 RepID=A0AAV2DUN1_9ROSI